MAICSVCGTNVAAGDRTCSFCGKSNPEFGLADASLDSEWMLLDEDTPSPPQPAPPPAAWAPPPSDGLGDDWLLLDDDAPPPAMPSPPPVTMPLTPFDLVPQPAPPPASPFDTSPDVELLPVPPSQPVLNVPASQLLMPSAPQQEPASRVCPVCGKTYGPDYGDSFCTCGVELVAARAPAATAAFSAVPAEAAAPPGPQRPPPGTRCLVLYGPDKRPLQFFPLTKDALLIGRLDPVNGCFPDVDVCEWVDEATARKVSRRHALVLHVRASDSFILRALPGNTGTQVNTEMLAGQDDVVLAPGTRVILGGVIRFKFEIA
jgi:hypothetical protein